MKPEFPIPPPLPPLPFVDVFVRYSSFKFKEHSVFIPPTTSVEMPEGHRCVGCGEPVEHICYPGELTFKTGFRVYCDGCGVIHYFDGKTFRACLDSNGDFERAEDKDRWDVLPRPEDVKASFYQTHGPRPIPD